MGHPRIDDVTRERVLELWRTPAESGKRRSHRQIQAQLKAEGRKVGRASIQRICAEEHEESLGTATQRVQERVAQHADSNLERIERMADILAHAAEHGQWPSPREPEPDAEPMECKGQVRVMAARDAVEASGKLLAYIGVKDDGDRDASSIVERARRLYGIATDQDDEAEEEHGSDGGNGVRVPWAH